MPDAMPLGWRDSGGAALRREIEHDAQPGLVVVERKRDAMQLDDGGNQRQAEPAARHGSAAVEPEEALEDLPARALRDARAGIRDAADRAAPPGGQRELDPGPGRRVADRILDQI